MIVRERVGPLHVSGWMRRVRPELALYELHCTRCHITAIVRGAEQARAWSHSATECAAERARAGERTLADVLEERTGR